MQGHKDKYDLVAITNDIDTKEEQRLLTVSGALSDLTIYVIDVAAAGKKISRKGGSGITKSDLLVNNKTDLAPCVGASLDLMQADTFRMRTMARV